MVQSCFHNSFSARHLAPSTPANWVCLARSTIWLPAACLFEIGFVLRGKAFVARPSCPGLPPPVGFVLRDWPSVVCRLLHAARPVKIGFVSHGRFPGSSGPCCRPKPVRADAGNANGSNHQGSGCVSNFEFTTSDLSPSHDPLFSSFRIIHHHKFSVNQNPPNAQISSSAGECATCIGLANCRDGLTLVRYDKERCARV